MTVEFQPFSKIARLSREIVVTEKIDGTNAGIQIVPLPVEPDAPYCAVVDDHAIFAQSRSRIITPKEDNFGFAKWVAENAPSLVNLGPGAHFGEWWGSGIQRGYGLAKGERRFSLFNVSRWSDPDVRPSCCHVVPELWRGDFDTQKILACLNVLSRNGSWAAPGFVKPEGVVVFHIASNMLFKKTIERDEEPKGFKP